MSFADATRSGGRERTVSQDVSIARSEHRKKRREPKQDTIVAIGYADRQREQTLAMAGKIKVEL